MYTYRLDTMCSALAKKPDSRAQACALVESLYSFLTLYSFPLSQKDDGTFSDYADVVMRNFFFVQNYSQRTFLNIIERLDSCGGVKRWFRDVSAENHVEINEENQILLNGRLLMDNEAFLMIESEICLHFSNYYCGNITKEQKRNCKFNILHALYHCLNRPYLRCIAPLYLFLSYKHLGRRFFEEEVFETDPTIFPFLKYSPALYNAKTEKADIRLMSVLHQALGSQYPFLIYKKEYLQQDSSENAMMKQYFAEELFELLVNNDPDISAAISPFLPIPDLLHISHHLLESNKDEPLVTEQELQIFLTALFDPSAYKKDFEDEPVWIALKAFEQVSRPQNFFSCEMGFSISIPCKTALKQIYNTLFKNTDSDTIISPDADPGKFFHTLKEHQFFQYLDLNMVAFARITHYAPAKVLYSYDPCLWRILPALDDFFSRQKVLIFRFFRFALVPEQPKKRMIKPVQLVCHALYEKWNFSHTDIFCNIIIPIAEFRYHDDGAFFQGLRENLLTANIDGLNDMLSDDSSTFYEEYKKRLLDHLSKKVDIDKLKKILSEIISAGCYIEESEMILNEQKELNSFLPMNNRLFFLCFVLYVLSDKSKKGTPFETLRNLEYSDDADFNYCCHALLDQCISLSIWDITSHYWEKQHEIADYLYPLRSNTSRRKQETKSQKDKSLEGEQVGKV